MWSNNYIRIPFKDCGRDENGCDCWGLARIIYKKELGIELPSLLGYTDTHERVKISNLYEQERVNWTEVPIDKIEPFDIIIMRTMGLPTHVGIAIGGGEMIHCERGIGTCINNYEKDPFWKKRFIGAYRYGKDNSSEVASSF